MHHEFAEKLHLTLAALGCVSQKDLCARFFAANAATHCTVPRLQKWMQGRAMPRSGEFYDDWVKVLGLDRTGAWMVACTAAELRALLVVPPTAGVAQAAAKAMPDRHYRAKDSGLLGGLRALAGSYAAYALSWSPPTRGCIIRGSLRLRADKNGDLQATYRETIATGGVRMTGMMNRMGRTLDVLLHDVESGLPLYLNLITPSPPINVLCGVHAGATFIAPSAMPSASRILLVRAAETARLDASNRYFVPGERAIADDLAALGIEVAEAERLDTMAATYFADEVVQVETATQAALSNVIATAHRHERPGIKERERAPTLRDARRTGRA